MVLVKNWDNVKEAFVKAWESIKNAWNECGKFFSGIWDGIKNAFAGAFTWLKDLGINMVKGLWQGDTEFCELAVRKYYELDRRNLVGHQGVLWHQITV